MSKKFQNRSEYNNFLSNALAIHGSITPKVLKNVFFVAVYSCLIALISHHYPVIKIGGGPFEYAGLILGLVLVFRINAGYDRWWEARKIWGDIVNNTRNFGLQILHQTDGLSYSEKKSLIGLASLMPYLIKKHLRHDENLEDINNLIGNIKNKLAASESNKPLYVSSIIANKLNVLLINNKISPFVFLQIEKQREKIIDCQGACERILNTPMPFVMAVKARRFILIFILLLPFSLVSASILLTPFIMSFVSYTLFSLDQIGVELQNPFHVDNLSHHPLSTICNNIEKDLHDLLEISNK